MTKGLLHQQLKVLLNISLAWNINISELLLFVDDYFDIKELAIHKLLSYFDYHGFLAG